MNPNNPSTPATRQFKETNLNMLDHSGDARRNGHPQGKAQCALAAARNISGNPRLTLLQISAEGYDQLTVRGPGGTWTRGESDGTSLHWTKFLRGKCSEESTQGVLRIPWRITEALTTEYLRMIIKAVIGEDMGGGPGTHATAIHAAGNLGTVMRPTWHYFDNEATSYPQPRFLVAARIGEEGLRHKISKGGRRRECGPWS